MARPVTPLKIAIVSSGITIRELAARIGRHESDLSRWALGRRIPPLEVAQALARELGSTVDELFPPAQRADEDEAA
jgi:transcriptional regulator with XRE-family HTH domain